MILVLALIRMMMLVTVTLGLAVKTRPRGWLRSTGQIRSSSSSGHPASTVRRVSQQSCPSHERLSSTWYKLSIRSDIVVLKQAPVPDTLCLGSLCWETLVQLARPALSGQPGSPLPRMIKSWHVFGASTIVGLDCFWFYRNTRTWRSSCWHW